MESCLPKIVQISVSHECKSLINLNTVDEEYFDKLHYQFRRNSVYYKRYCSKSCVIH